MKCMAVVLVAMVVGLSFSRPAQPVLLVRLPNCVRSSDTEMRITLLQKILYILSILVGIVFYKDRQDRQD